MCAGLPRLEEKRLSAAMKAFEVRSDTNSKCMAFVAKQTNKHTNALLVLHPLPFRSFIKKGPA